MLIQCVYIRSMTKGRHTKAPLSSSWMIQEPEEDNHSKSYPTASMLPGSIMMMKYTMLAGLRSNICSNLMANQAEQFNKSINVAYNNNESFIFRQPSISNQLIKVL